MQKKNILLIVHCLPYPLNSGGRQAIFNGILAIKDDYNIFITYPDTDTAQDRIDKQAFLTAIGENVKLLPFVNNNTIEKRSFVQKVSCKMIALLNKICKTKQVPPNPYSYWIEELLPKSKSYIDHIRNIIKDCNIDAVQCEMVRNLPLVLSLPCNIKTIFVHHELGFTRHQLELESLSSDFYDGQTICNWAKCLEISLLNKFDHVVTLSSTDSQKLRNAGVTTRIHDSFAIVKSSQVANLVSDNPLELSFVGPDNHIPNIVGLKWFLDKCWTRLLQADANYHLRIIGKWSDKNITSLSTQYPNVSFMGFVENLESAIQNTIMIVPITIGSGIRMKILEAAKLGIPFVSTTIGAEGIPVQSGKHCLLADDPSDFVDAILQLRDHDKRAMFIKKAHQLIEDNYSLEALKLNRHSLYASIFNK